MIFGGMYTSMHLSTLGTHFLEVPTVSRPLPSAMVSLNSRLVDRVPLRSIYSEPLGKVRQRGVCNACRYTVDSLITYTLDNPYSLKTHSFFHFPSWYAGIL